MEWVYVHPETLRKPWPCRWISFVGAAMSACYSIIACVTSAVAVDGTADFSRRGGSTADHAFEIMNALGTIMFAYGGHAVLLEIEVGLDFCPVKPVVLEIHEILCAIFLKKLSLFQRQSRECPLNVALLWRCGLQAAAKLDSGKAVLHTTT